MTKSIPKEISEITESQSENSTEQSPGRERLGKGQGRRFSSSPGVYGRLVTLLSKSRSLNSRVLLLVLVIFGTGLGLAWAEGQRERILAELPDPQSLLTYAQPGSRLLKAADGSILLQLGATPPQDASLGKMPPKLVQAFVAAEDQRFYQHNGVDYPSILRAIVANLKAGQIVEGGSTLTQQLARIVFLNQDQSIDRKIKEALMAQKIEGRFDKGQVLERYLNLVYLGSGAYGVTDAAWIYFSKSLNDLTLAERATLAAMPPAPSVYSPLINPDLAKRERNKVLGRMEDQGYITPEESILAQNQPLVVNPADPPHTESPYPYFTSFIEKELDRLVEESLLSDTALEQGGLVIETTLNPEWQALVQEIVLWIVNRDGQYERFEQGAFVIIDPRTGAIPVMIGGMDFQNSEFNRVTQAHRSPGSTFKTFVYTAAVASGFSPHKTYVDAPLTVDGYTPKNYGGTFRGTVSIVDALTHSVNTVALKTLLDVGFQPVKQVAQQMGIQSDLQETYSLALGASEVTLLELTSAYGALANEGVHVPSHGIRRILNSQGQVLFEANSEKPTIAIDKDTAAIVTWMLQNVVERGTGRAAKLSDRPVAGKTGTSEGARDLWFIGYIPQLVAGVWLGNDNNTPTWGSSGTAAYLWKEVMQELLADMPVEEFPELPDLSRHKGTLTAVPIKPNRIQAGSESSSSSDGFEEFDSGSRWEPEPVDSSSWQPDESASESVNPEDSSQTIEEETTAPDNSSEGLPEGDSGSAGEPIAPDGIPYSGDQPVVYPAPIDELPPPIDEPAPLPEPLPPSDIPPG